LNSNIFLVHLKKFFAEKRKKDRCGCTIPLNINFTKLYSDIIFYKIGKVQKLKVKKISEKESDKEKDLSEEIKITNEEMERYYYKSLIMVIIAPIIVAFILYSTSPILILIGVPLGIIIGLYGLYGIYLYKSKPETYRERLEKKKSGESIRNRGIIKIIIGIIIFSIGFLEIYLCIELIKENSWKVTSSGGEFSYLIWGFIFFLIGSVITRSSIIDYKKKVTTDSSLI